jgi:FtsP/CotA-like multicopper oxidase with cupredoxin domain
MLGLNKLAHLTLLILLLANCSLEELKNSQRGGDQGPRLVKISITAAPTEIEYRAGKKTKVWAFNGTVPGPTMHANVGDTLQVHFKNELPEPATLHWHGIELPANMDGSHISQNGVPPGGTFVYRFKLLRAATYWYHSHIKPHEQIEKGLHGAVVVHDPNENRRLALPKRDDVFILDDVLLDDQHQVAPPFPEDPEQRAIVQANGREGNLLLVNGKNRPTMQLEQGVPFRMRFVNAANSRFMRLSFPKNVEVHRIGGDTGLLQAPRKIEPIPLLPHPKEPGLVVSDQDESKGFMIVPGERAELIVISHAEVGSRIPVTWHDLKRGRHITHRTPEGYDLVPDPIDGNLPSQTMWEFRVIKPHYKKPQWSLPEQLRPTEILSSEQLSDDKPLKVTFGHSLPSKSGDMMFFATMRHDENGMQMLPMMQLTDATALNAKVGETRIIEVTNMSSGIHPFHLHGFAFQLLDTTYMDQEKPETNVKITAPPEEKEWKDTISIPGRPGFRARSRAVVRLLVRFDDQGRAGQVVAHGGKPVGDRSGGWLAHCHILEHAALGMATWLNLR